MDLAQFKASFAAVTPPADLPLELRALWLAHQDDWHGAHNLVDDKPGANAAWVHAYLHRVEGDEWNAGYWYRKARKPMPQQSLEEEWEAIAISLLAELT